MEAGLRALLTQIVDYAGLFPPAQLPLAPAIANYLRDRQSPETWMLSRFVCPTAKMVELLSVGDDLIDATPPAVRLAALGRTAATRDAFREQLDLDLTDIIALTENFGGKVIADAAEVRFPADLARAPAALAVTNLLEEVAERAAIVDAGPLPTCWEAPLDEFYREVIPALAEGIARFNEKHTRPNGEPEDATWPRCGFKLRCGGVVASAVPSSERVAFVIKTCRDAGIPMKFTAGLHHPLRMHRPEIDAEMHGFLNVFVAGVLAHARGLDEAAIREILDLRDAAAFTFDADGITCRGARATLEEITVARQEFVLSFGSCSFDEPREDLRALGLMV